MTRVSLDNTPLYIRGFLASSRDLTETPKNFRKINHHDLFVYAEQQTPVEIATSGSYEVLVFGVLVDAEHPERSPAQIAALLLTLLPLGRHTFLKGLFTIGGRYAILARDSNGYFLVGDAGGVRSLFYQTTQYGYYVSSHAALIADQTGASLNPLHANIQRLGDSSRSKARNWPGRQSRFQGICQLTANTFLSLPECSVERFFPLQELPSRSAREAALIAAPQMKNAMNALERHYAGAEPFPFLLLLTSGLDSRLVLSAIRNQTRKTQALTYWVSEAHNADVRGAETLARLADLKFNSFRAVDSNLKPTQEWALRNGGGVFSGSRAVIDHMAQHFSSYRFSLRGNLGEIARGVYLRQRKFISDPVRYMARIWFQGSEENLEILNSFEDYAAVTQMDRAAWPIRILYYWEHRHGTWHAATVNTMDAAFDTFNVLNSRSILEAMCGVSEEDQVNSRVHQEIIKHFYPELLEIPVNPKD